MPKKRPFFDEVDSSVDFPSLEESLLKEWYSSGLVDKFLKKNKDSKKTFSFLDGPITANNPMGVHHAWGRTYKDLWQRYKNMQGYRQRFQNGFDSQGLWVEVEVEKDLGFKSKKEIEKYGVAEFVQKCRDRVVKYSAIQTDQSKRLGFFMDWDNSYFTMSDENNYMIWHFLKVCHEHGWIYKGKESVPWCPRCQTAISQHEMLTEDYKEVVHKSIYMQFPIEGREKEYLLVWTTTPWTIPANIAVAVDKNLDYSLVQKKSGGKFWVAEEAVKRIFGKEENKILKTVKGEKLVGLKYKGPFDNLAAVRDVARKNSKTFHAVVSTDDRLMPISSEEGTGLVHTAVSAGTEDFKLGKKLGLPMIPVIADNADYLPGLDFLSGKNAKKHPELILDYMSKGDKKTGIDWVYRIEKYRHRYPACWRCKTELVWKVTDEWYIAMDKGQPSLRERMKEVAKKINWIPEFGLKRELDWLENMNDWLISKKNRYWGLALPIWECLECGHFELIGSKEELKKKTIKGWDKFSGKSPHKPQIDEIKLKCSKCSELMSRIEPVGNPWLDAGIVSFSTIAEDNKGEPLYTKNKKKWQAWYPADFITESFPGQFKNWFYSLIAMSTVLENKEPMKTVLGFATLQTEDGKPMHKSSGNMIEFNEGADKIGVDVMRWIFVRQNPSENLLFGYNLADETRRRFHLRLWNIYNFFVTYANLDGWKPNSKNKTTAKSSSKMFPLDNWIISRLSQTQKTASQSLDAFEAHLASQSIEKLVDDLSLWYIRRSRERVGPSALSEKDKNSFYETLYLVLTTLTKLLAPLTPYLADEIYRNLTKEESVHLADWPETTTQPDLSLIKDMELMREIAEKTHARRKEKRLPVRQPLSFLEVTSSKAKPSAELLTILLQELNIEKIAWKKGGELKVSLETKITPELKEKAKARELIRKIQIERKNLGLDLSQKAVVINNWLPKGKELKERIKRKTVTQKLVKGKSFKLRKAS